MVLIYSALYVVVAIIITSVLTCPLPLHPQACDAVVSDSSLQGTMLWHGACSGAVPLLQARQEATQR